jgi:hypothetical protein
MVRTLASTALALLCCTAFAGPTPAPVRTEIDALLSRLESSGCQFSRNGTWYTGADARTHLQRKLEGAEARTTLQSTEQFVTLVASKSSASGKPYMVKCGSEAAVESSRWLGGQLASVRAAGGKGKP